MYQMTHRTNADTITPAQYQPRRASSLIGSSSLFRDGLYTRSLGVLALSRLSKRFALTGPTSPAEAGLGQQDFPTPWVKANSSSPPARPAGKSPCQLVCAKRYE